MDRLENLGSEDIKWSMKEAKANNKRKDVFGDVVYVCFTLGIRDISGEIHLVKNSFTIIKRFKKETLASTKAKVSF